RYAEVILATLRTNYYQFTPAFIAGSGATGNQTPQQVRGGVLSFKFDSGRVPELPLPKPYAEIVVYGTRVEGIHLRGGQVARGGLWFVVRRCIRLRGLGRIRSHENGYHGARWMGVNDAAFL